MASPFAARRPPCVLRMRNSGSRSLAGSQPMPALWVKPKRLPDGSLSSISAVSGRTPAGPDECVDTRQRSWSAVSKTDVREGVAIEELAFNQIIETEFTASGKGLGFRLTSLRKGFIPVTKGNSPDGPDNT